MKSKLKLLIIIIFSFCLFFLWNINSVFAASANISGKTTVQKGERVTITATVNAGAWNLKLSGAGQTVQLVGQTNTTGNSSDSKSITFVANSNTTFTLTGEITDYSDEISRPVTKSTTIKVSENSSTTSTPSTTTTSQNNNQSTVANTNQNNNKKSNNANLSNLGIRPNDFSGFKAGTTTYNVTVPENIETIEVYAKAQDPKSKISGTGKRKLQKGKNTASVTVTAEDGTKKTYTINITRKEQEEEKEDGEAQGQKDEESTDEQIKEENGLAKLEIQDVSLSPSFQSNIYEYTVKYIGEETKLNIDAQSTNKEYTVEITGNEELKEGENIITILVSDAQSNNVATYQITVNKSLVDEETIKQEQEDKEKDENKKKIIIYGGIAIGIFIVVIIIFIIWRKRNRKLEEEYGVPFYNENHNNQLEDFDKDMKYKGNFRANNNEQRENKKIMKEKYLDIYNRRDIELDRLEEEGNRKNKNRGKRFR